MSDFSCCFFLVAVISPESAQQSQFAIEDGDVILLATDGVFDNVPQPMLVAELAKLGGVQDEGFVQQTANSIALMARTLAFDPRYMSPFAQRARDYGIQAIGPSSTRFPI